MSDSQSSRRRGIALGRAMPISAPKIIEAPFPERRTLHWLPPDRITTEDFSIVVTSEVLLQTSKHVAQTLDQELGGFLLGNRYQCPNTGRNYIIIDQYVVAESVESTGVSLTFTHEAWGQLEDKLTGKYYGKQLVGWYHSHPGMSIFLSEHDLFIHQNRFPEPWMVALVLEPKKHLGGFFVWNNGKVDPNHFVNFYELLEGDSRSSVVAWKNYNGVDPVQGVAPILSPVNSENPEGSEPVTGSGRDVVFSPAASNLPDWLHGNVLWFGGAALALVVFLAMAIYFLAVRPGVNNNTNSGEEVSTSQKAFGEVKVEIDNTGKVDFRNNTISLRLKLSGLPEGLAKDVKSTVSIDDKKAIVDLVPKGGELSINANLQSQEIAKKVDKNRGGQYSTLQIDYLFEYKGEKHTDSTRKWIWLTDPDRGILSVSDSLPAEDSLADARDRARLEEARKEEARREEARKQEARKQEARKQEAEKEDARKEAARQEQLRKDQERQSATQTSAAGRTVAINKQIDDLGHKKSGLETQLRNSGLSASQRKKLTSQLEQVKKLYEAAKKKLREIER